MTKLTRRSMVGGAMVLAALLEHPLWAQPASPGEIEIPEAPMILQRRIERALFDGASIIVTRSWEIAFARSGRGITVTGRQIEAQVEAPEKLAKLAQLEEERDTSDMFPILLSPYGRIVGAGSAESDGELARAVEIASGLIERSDARGQDKSAVLHYLSALQAAGGSVVDALPADLFYPSVGEQGGLRKVDLPNGEQGEIELIRTAQLAPGKAWLGQSIRKIVTRVAGTSQESREIWNMQPKPAPD